MSSQIYTPGSRRQNLNELSSPTGVASFSCCDGASCTYSGREERKGAFEARLGSWLQERGLPPGEARAVDGKTLRGIHGEALPGVHLVAAYARRSGVVAGQQAAEGKGRELAAVRALLEGLPLGGQLVTGDAQFAQRDLSRLVVAKGGTTSGS